MMGLLLLIILTMLVAFIAGWKISRPLMNMTEYTNKMKKAPSLAKKIKIVQEMSEEPLFDYVNLQYKRMRVAKEMLEQRMQQRNPTLMLRRLNTIQR